MNYDMTYSGKILFLLISALGVLIVFYFKQDCLSENGSIVLEDFERYSDKDNIFKNWLLRNDNKKEASNVYSIYTENNNRFLNARSSGDSIQIAKKIKWDINSFPVFSWKWRANKLPDEANEDAKGKNDSGAAIYVIFQRNRIPFLPWEYQPINVLKYVWSTNLPADRVVRKEKTKAGKVIYEGYFFVIESGQENLCKWITEERNVLKDYVKVFGENPKYNPFLIAILSDSNDTKNTAVADYDDIIVKRTGVDNLNNTLPAP